MGHTLTEQETENIINDIESAQQVDDEAADADRNTLSMKSKPKEPINGFCDGSSSNPLSPGCRQSRHTNGDGIGKHLDDSAMHAIVTTGLPESRSILVDGEVRIDFKQFEVWYTKSLFWGQKLTQFQNEQVAADGGFAIDYP